MNEFKWNGYANCKQISGATVNLVEDTPDTTDGVVKISGSPEQADKAQSLLQGFILSSASLPLSFSLFKTLAAFTSIISLNKKKITSIILHHNINHINCINKLPKLTTSTSINIQTINHTTNTVQQQQHNGKCWALVNHHLLAVASRRKPYLLDHTHTYRTLIPPLLLVQFTF